VPIKQCTVDGVSGYKWGDSGKCYTGPKAKEKARVQGVAIEVNKSLHTPDRLDGGSIRLLGFTQERG